MSEIVSGTEASWKLASEQLYRAVVLSSNDAIVIFDRHERILDFSPSAVELFGYDHEEVLGAPFSSLFPERFRIDSEGSGCAWIEHARLTKDRIHVEGLHKDGSELEIEVGAHCVSSGEDEFYCASIRDLSAYMREAAVEARRSLLQTLVADCTSSLISKDEILEQAMGRIASFLDVAVTRILEVHGQGESRILISDEFWASHEVEGEPAERARMAWEALRSPELFEHLGSGQVLACRDADSCPFPEVQEIMLVGGMKSLLVMPIFSSGRLDSLWTLEVHDEPRAWPEYEVHLLDALRLAIARSIERVSAERELHSTWTQLRAALRTSESATRAKSEFIANVSHEIRTPMTAIVGYSDLLLSKYAHDEQVRSWSTLIQRNGEHLLTLINDILDFSKIEAGQLKLSPTTIDVRETMAEALDALEWSSERAAVPLHVAVAEDVPQHVVCDPVRLRQIVFNFCSNAIKFTKEGQVDLRVTCETLDAEGKVLLAVEVEDTGIGIEEDKIEELFSMFTQVHEGGNEFGGTGLGLAISRRLAQLMGGDVSVRSELGVGSVFRAELLVTVASPEEARELRADTGQAVASGERPELRGKRVLVVDDVGENRVLFQFILEDSGLDVTTAEDGEAAIQAIEAGDFDLVLMDMQMPVKDGYTATRELRAAGSVLPIVALTASAMSDDAQRCFEAGCDVYVTKPVRPAALLDAVAKSIRGVPRVAVDEITAPELAAGEAQGFEHREITPLFSDLPDKPAYRELLDDYLDAIPSMLEAVEASFVDGEADGLYDIAHKLTGSAGCYGFPQVSAIAGYLQTELSQEAELASVRDLVDQLVVALRGVVAGTEIMRARAS